MKKITLLLLTFVFVHTLFAQYDIDDTQNSTFTDISTTGTALNLGDNEEVNITVPFSIQLGNTSSNKLRVGNCGTILFDATSGEISPSNGNLTTDAPMIAPFWDDFDSEMGDVYYKTITSSVPGGLTITTGFIVQWDRVHYNGSSNTDIASFQVKFSAFYPEIVFVYADVDMDGTAWDNGASATIGISTSDRVSQYSYNTASLNGVTTLVFSEAKSTIMDDAFENYLETHNYQGYPRDITDDDTMGDGIANNNLVLTRKIVNVTDLTISGLGILTLNDELEDFDDLVNLDCSDNEISGVLNFTNNPKLSKLQCDNNDLTEIITANNNNLTYLDCSDNQYFATISLLGKTLLTYLDISNTDISQIDDTDGNDSNDLYFIDNVSLTSLSAVNVSRWVNRIDVYRQLNLVSLDVSNNHEIDEIILPEAQSSLKYFTMENIQARDYNAEIINIPNSINLETFVISGTSAFDNSILGGDVNIERGLLDFSNCTKLQMLWIARTEVKVIDLRGVTANIISGGFNVKDNLLLHCIYVDDVANAQSKWDSYKDYGTSFVANETACENRVTYVPDDVFENYLETHNSLDEEVAIGAPNSMGNGIANDNYVLTKNIEAILSGSSYVPILTLDGLQIADLTGIEGFTAIEQLYLSNNNNITTINLPNKWLSEVTCENNSQLTSIDLTKSTRIESLYLSNNQLTSVDLPQSISLYELYLSNNQLTSLDLTQNVKLYRLDLSNNQLTSLDLTQNTELYTISLSNNKLTSIDLTQNTELSTMYLSNNQLTSIDLTHNTELDELYLSDNQLTSIDLTQNTGLDKLDLENNQLTSLDLTHNYSLNYLNCNSNQLISLNLDQNEWINILDIRNNNLTELHIQNGNNSGLSGTYVNDGNNYSRFRAQNNSNLTCVFVDNATDATNGVNDYQDWQVDATAHFVEIEAECGALAVAENEIENLSIYPTPVQNMLNIEALNNISSLKIYNIIGQVVLVTKLNTTNAQIDVSSLPSGSYMVELISNNKIGVYKIIKK